MKAKIELTQEQQAQLCGHEEKMLRAKFERDLIALKKKYAYIEIEIEAENQSEKIKLSDEMFLDYFNNQKMSISQIAELTKYSKAYLYKIKKRVLAEK